MARLALVACSLLLVAGPAGATPRTHTIIVDKMGFGAVPKGVRVGDIIVWRNRDMFQHSATSKGQFDVDLPPGKKAKMRVTRSGTFPVLCKYHSGMKAVLKVAK